MLRRPGAAPLDVPDARKLHSAPTPRGGGLGILVGTVASLAIILPSATSRWPDLATAMIYAVASGALGFVDDRHPLRSPPKFVLQILMASVAAWFGLRFEVLEIPFAGS